MVERAPKITAEEIVNTSNLPLGRKIHLLRDCTNQSRKIVAGLIGVSTRGREEIESGRRLPSPLVLANMCDALGINEENPLRDKLLLTLSKEAIERGRNNKKNKKL